MGIVTAVHHLLLLSCAAAVITLICCCCHHSHLLLLSSLCCSQVLPVLEQWGIRLIKLQNQHTELERLLGGASRTGQELLAAVAASLHAPAPQPAVQPPVRPVVAEVPKQPTHTLPAWAVQGEAELGRLEESAALKIVTHFQHLFDMAAVEGVLPRMNEVRQHCSCCS